MFVDTDGTVYSNAYWDEGAKEAGIYKNGQCTGWIQNQHTSVIAGEYVSLLISGLAKEFLLGVNETP